MCSLFSILREPTVNRKDLRALTLAGPTREQPSTRPPSCATPQQLTIDVLSKVQQNRRFCETFLHIGDQILFIKI